MWLPAQSWLIAKLIKHIIEPGFQPGMGRFGLEEKDHPVPTPLPRGPFSPCGQVQPHHHNIILISSLNLQVEQPWNMPIVKCTCQVQLKLWDSRVLNLLFFWNTFISDFLDLVTVLSYNLNTNISLQMPALDALLSAYGMFDLCHSIHQHYTCAT